MGFCPDTTCSSLFNSRCVYYESVYLPYTGVATNDSLQTALQKIEEAVRNIVLNGGGGGAIWGSITGTISNQADLISYLSNNYVPQSRTLTINGTPFDLSSNRSWSVGTVTSVDASGGTTGLSFTGSPITTSGTFTLEGTLNVANGGTGATSFTVGRILFGNGTSAIATDSEFTFDSINKAFTVRNVRIGSGNDVTQTSVYIGPSSGNFTGSGSRNIGIGSTVLSAVTSGSDNVFVGHASGALVTSGGQNVGIGRESLNAITTQGNNVAIGYRALFLATAASNIAIGRAAGQNITTGASNIIIGTNVDAQSATTNGQLSIQNAIFGTNNTGTGTTVSSGNVGFYIVNPTARLHLPGGSLAANSAPLKINSGTAMSTPEDGAFEYHTSHLYFTIGSTRYQLDQQSSGISDGNKGDITVTSSGATWTINNDAVTYSKIQNVSATNRFLGRITLGAGDIEELTGTQATTLLDTFTSALKGLVPPSGGGTTNFLRADGTWASPGGGGITNGAANNELAKSNGTNLVASGLFSTTVGSLVFGTGLAGGSRGLTADGSSADVGFSITSKGTGTITLALGSGAAGVSIETTGISLGSSTINMGSTAIAGTARNIIATGSGLDIDLRFVAKGIGNIDFQNDIMAYRFTGSGLSNQNASSFTLEGFSGGDATGDLLIKAGSGSVSNNSGSNLYLTAGNKAGSGSDGNIAINTVSVSNWQGMEKGTFIANVTSAPSAAIADGVALYSIDNASNSTFAIRQENAVITDGSPTTTHKMPIIINGTLYYAILTDTL